MRRQVVGDRDQRGADLAAFDVDPAEVLGEAAGLRDQDRADPLAVREQVVRMGADNCVDLPWTRSASSGSTVATSRSSAKRR